MTKLRLRRRSNMQACLALGSALLAGSAFGQDQENPRPADPGWTAVIAGAPPSMTPEAFKEAVLADLPPELYDRNTNFTRHESYREDAEYKLVMVFHGANDIPPTDQLCTVDPANTEEVETTQPQLDNIMESTGVTAAFCEDGKALSTATDKVTGQATPGQLAFRFLVGDVVKQLFPDGFSVMPRPVTRTVIPAR